MTTFVVAFETIFGFLVYNKLFNIPILVWFILPAVITLVVNFIQGKK